jgi:hypothetical protein
MHCIVAVVPSEQMAASASCGPHASGPAAQASVLGGSTHVSVQRQAPLSVLPQVGGSACVPGGHPLASIAPHWSSGQGRYEVTPLPPSAGSHRTLKWQVPSLSGPQLVMTCVPSAQPIVGTAWLAHESELQGDTNSRAAVVFPVGPGEGSGEGKLAPEHAASPRSNAKPITLFMTYFLS